MSTQDVKIIVVGPLNVGKTVLLYAYFNGVSDGDYGNTIAPASFTRFIATSNGKI